MIKTAKNTSWWKSYGFLKRFLFSLVSFGPLSIASQIQIKLLMPCHSSYPHPSCIDHRGRCRWSLPSGGSDRFLLTFGPWAGSRSGVYQKKSLRPYVVHVTCKGGCQWARSILWPETMIGYPKPCSLYGFETSWSLIPTPAMTYHAFSPKLLAYFKYVFSLEICGPLIF